MITFRQKGDFSKLTRFLERAKESVRLGDLDTAAGYRGETTSILLSSLFLTKLQMRHGRRLLSYEYNC